MLVAIINKIYIQCPTVTFCIIRQGVRIRTWVPNTDTLVFY